MGAPIFDDKKFLVFFNPEYVADLIDSTSEKAGNAEGMITPEVKNSIMRRISTLARKHGGEAHYSAKPGRRTARRPYRLVFTDGNQADTMTQFDRELKRLIASACEAPTDKPNGN
jgi:hypothetical protein